MPSHAGRAPFAPVAPPVEPMLAKSADAVPAGPGYLYEPKWDGFRALVFRHGANLFIQSRDLHPFDRYFPDLHDAMLERLPTRCVIDGEIVIATKHGLDFDALQLRLHPASSRVAKLAAATPASFVVFDLLAIGGRDLRAQTMVTRRAALEANLADVSAPIYVTPMTRDIATARRWLREFEGAGLDGVVAKPETLTYQPGKRAMIKIKHVRTADCVVAGFRWHRAAPSAIGSLLLGLYDARGVLQHVGVTSSFTMEQRHALVKELAPLRRGVGRHPWLTTAGREARVPGGDSRWSAGKDLSWEPLRPERVCEVKYDHLQGDRFRHAAQFVRWRPDKPPTDCRFDQLEVATPFELSKVLRAARPARR